MPRRIAGHTEPDAFGDIGLEPMLALRPVRTGSAIVDREQRIVLSGVERRGRTGHGADPREQALQQER